MWQSNFSLLTFLSLGQDQERCKTKPAIIIVISTVVLKCSRHESTTFSHVVLHEILENENFWKVDLACKDKCFVKLLKKHPAQMARLTEGRSVCTCICGRCCALVWRKARPWCLSRRSVMFSKQRLPNRTFGLLVTFAVSGVKMHLSC